MCVQCGDSPADQVIDHSITHPFNPKPGDEWTYCQEPCGLHVSRHPDKMDFLAKRQMEAIIEQGHQVTVVFPSDSDGYPFAYSVGRCVAGRPELLVTGWLGAEMLGYIVNRVADIDNERVEQGWPDIKDGDQLVDVLDGFPVKIMEVADLRLAQMYGVASNFGDDVPALQIVWPDSEGRFPGDEGCTLNQPVYNSGFTGVLKKCEGGCGGFILCSPDEPAPKDCKDHS